MTQPSQQQGVWVWGRPGQRIMNGEAAWPSTDPRPVPHQKGGILIRRVATRHEKRATNHLAMLTLAAIVLWL